MAQLIIMILVVRLLIAIMPGGEKWLKGLVASMAARFRRIGKERLFDDHFIDAKTYYLREFKAMPCIAFIGNIEVGKAFELVQTGKYGKVKKIFQRTYYNWEEAQMEFTKTLFKLDGAVLIRLGETWAEIYHGSDNYALADKLMNALKEFKAPEKEQDYEINIITLTDRQLDLKTIAIKPTDLDLNLYYNEDFIAIDAVIKERLTKENDKGIVLLHGLPGTGKTTYLRHLIGSMKKKVMFVSPGVAHNLMNPDFMDLLIDNPNTVLVIEDAENIIMDRRYSSQSSVSNLLNISDGLLSDCLNVQIICTFNSELSLIDNALLRKGRLIAKYEFGKLSVTKARALAKHLELDTTITEPMTLAEITNPGEPQQVPKVNVIGFRRTHELIEN